MEEIFSTEEQADQFGKLIQRLFSLPDTNIDENLFSFLKGNSFEEKSKLEYGSCIPFKNDIQSLKSREFPRKNEESISKSKISASTDGDISSDLSELPDDDEDLGIVKSILGPSFEDALLRTFEFGKSLIQKSENSETDGKEIRQLMKKNGKRKTSGKLLEDDKLMKKNGKDKKRRDSGKTAEKQVRPKIMEVPKSFNVSKIRSLDSELKQVSQSPEKIKRQLEALIQINKDEPLDMNNPWDYLYSKKFNSIKPHLEYTVMPTTVVRKACCPVGKRDGCICGPNCTGAGTCCAGAEERRAQAEYSQERTSSQRQIPQSDERSIRSMPGAIARQAPEYISNALGPTLDVSIMENLQMISNLLKCEKNEEDGGGEPKSGRALESSDRSRHVTQQTVEELERKVDELNKRRLQLEKEIEEEERERDEKRKAFQEEMQNARMACSDPCRGRSGSEQKIEALKCQIKNEEDRLCVLKQMSESYETAINEAKRRKNNLQRNKSLLDAWDIIASRVCHTRLPSFSKVQCLERKCVKPNKDAQHCCFPQTGDDVENKAESPMKASSSAQFNRRSRSSEDKSARRCMLINDNPYPLQRDVTCGLHSLVKTCLCNEPLSKNNSTWSSEEDLLSSAMNGTRMPIKSKSETGRREHGTKLCRVLWAVTRINIFRDNSRTYEVMDATTIPPKCLPVRTEGVFVVKNPNKCCPGQ